MATVTTPMSNHSDVDSPARVTPGPARPRSQSELITPMSRTGSGLSPSRAASPIIEDDSLNGSQDEADAFDGDSSQQQSAAEASLAWFRGRVQSMLRLRSDRVDDLVIKNADTKRIFLDFIHEPARRRLLVWPGEDDELHAGYDMPCEGRKKAIYFIKQRSFRVEEDGNLSGLMMGDLPCDVLEHLSTVSHEVLYPVLMAGRAKDPDSINKEISDVFHKFLSQVYLTVGQAQGKTLLPLPPRDPNQREGMDARMVKTDKERVHVLESCVVTWTQQIKKVLRQEPPTFIYPGDIETGTKSEFAYWSSRAMDLTSIHEQLSSTKVQKVLQILEVTKSTYEKPLQKLVKEVAHAKHEACDIDLHLAPLAKVLQDYRQHGKQARAYAASKDASKDAQIQEAHGGGKRFDMAARLPDINAARLKAAARTPFEEMGIMFRPVLHTIALIYANSQFYRNTPRLQSILEKLCNDVIHAALQYVNGAHIFSLEPEEMEQRLNTTIAIFGQLRSTYLEVRSSSEKTEFPWGVQDDLVLNLPDQFVERCYDMIDLVQMTCRFAALKHVQVGGLVRMARSIDQIITEFHQALKRVEATGYDLLDIAAKKYDDDFFLFRRTVRDCERRLGSLIAERMETCSTLTSQFNFLACFQVMLDRKIIVDCIQVRQMQLVEMLSRELDAVQQAFKAGKDKAPPYLNMPHHASRIMWSRSLSDRLQGPMACAQRMLSNVMLTPPGRSVSERYEQLLATLKAFEEKEIEVWLEQIDLKFAEKLKKPLLVRDLTSTGIRVNFDQGLMALLREAKYLNLINIDMPDGVRGVYSKADVYQQHEANLHLIVNDYNALLMAMNEVEVPLMLPKLELVDEALEEGIELLNWRNHSIASFIKKSTSYIADASALLKVLQTNVKRICNLLKGWSTASLHTHRKKTLFAEEYLQTLQDAIQARYNAFREDSHMIGNLIGEIHLALQVSRGDAAWRQYIAHVNLLITTTLQESVIESFEAIIAMLDPAQRKEGSAALVEVRLELVAPDVFFNPDVNSNLSGSGLEDILEFWISSTLGVAKLLLRIDVGEGNYMHDVANDARVLLLISTLRQHAESVFQRLCEFKCVYEKYSDFWLQEPGQQFASFLALLNEHADSPADHLVAFDQQVSTIKQTENEIKKLNNREHMVWVSVDAKPMKQALFTLLSKWTFTYTNHLVQKVLLETEEMQAFVTSAAGKLKVFTEESDRRDVKTSTTMPDIMATISQVKKMSSKADEMFAPWSSLINMLKGYGVQVPSWVQKHVSTAPNQWHQLKMHMFQCRTLLEDFIAREQVRLKKESSELRARAVVYRGWFEREMPFTLLSDTRDSEFAYQAIDLQRRVKEHASALAPPLIKRTGSEKGALGTQPFGRAGSITTNYNMVASTSLATLLAEIQELNAQEDMFDLPQTVDQGLLKCQNDLVLLKQVWDLVSLVNGCYQRWQDLPWQGVNLEEVRDQVFAVFVTVISGSGDVGPEWHQTALQHAASGSPMTWDQRNTSTTAGRFEAEEWRTWPVYVSLVDRLKNLLESLHLIKLLQSPILRQRHWKQLTRFTGSGLLNEHDMRLGEMMSLNLPAHASSVHELVDGAHKESEIEVQLVKIEKRWSHLELQLQLDDSGHHVLQPPDEILEVLDESLVQVQQLNFNPYVIRNSTFSDQVATLQKQLGTTETLLNNWMLAQHKHSTLHALFCTQAARTKCAHVASDLDAIDASWNAMMAQAATMPSVVDTCTTDEREKQVRTLLTRLEDAQMQVRSYLDAQRIQLPRLFLISNDALLLLLSYEGQPKEAIPFVRLLFPGVHELGLEFKDNGEVQVLTSVRDRKSDRIPLLPIRCDGAVEDWIAGLDTGLRDSVARELMSVVEAVEHQNGGLNSQEAANAALELVLIVLGLSQSRSIQAVLEEGGELDGLLLKLQLQLDDWLLQLRNRETQEDDRARTSALVVSGMGWRDCIMALAAEANLQRSPDSFTWQAQMRYSLSSDKKCMVEIGRQRIAYGCNFIGHYLSSLVRTASVRALQLSLCYAVEQFTGVVIQGGIGCGKSETLKGTAHALGNTVGVFGGGGSVTAQALLDCVTGYSCAGMWMELRNVSRLPLNVVSCLSEVARAVLQVCRTNRMRAASRKRREAEQAAAAKRNKRLAGGKQPQTPAAEAEVEKEADLEDVLAHINGIDVMVHTSFALLNIADGSEPGSGALGGSVTWNSTLGRATSLPPSLAKLFRPVGMMEAEPAAVVSTWMLASGFRHAGKLGAALYNYMIMCQRSLTPASHYVWNLSTCKDAIQVAASKLGAVPEAPSGGGGLEETEGLRGEMHMLGSAVFDLVQPRLVPQDHVTFLHLTNIFFFSDDSELLGASSHADARVDVARAEQQEQAHPLSARAHWDATQNAKQNGTTHETVHEDRDQEAQQEPQGVRTDETEAMRADDQGAKMQVPSLVEPDASPEAEAFAPRVSATEAGGQGKQEVETNLEEAAQQLHLQLTDGFVTRCTQMKTLLTHFPTCFVLGPAASGKSALIQMAAAQRSPASQPTTVRCINPKALPVGRLLGCYDAQVKHKGQDGKWLDGVLAAILRDMLASDTEGGGQQLLVLDGAIDATWADPIVTLLPRNGHLLLASHECLNRTPSLKLVFETENLHFASPAMLASGAVLSLSSADLGWSAYAQSWLEARQHLPLAPALLPLFGSGPHDMIPQALRFLRSDCSFSTVANQVRDHEHALVKTLCSLIAGSQVLDEQVAAKLAGLGSADGRARSPLEDNRQLGGSPIGRRTRGVQALVCTFVHSLVWSLGGLLDRESKVKFNAWIRQTADTGILGPGWVPYPRSGTVFEYYFDLLDAAWKGWSENLREFRYLWGGNEDSASEMLLVPTQHNIAVQHGMTLLHKGGQPILLHGAAGSGKTWIVRDFLASLDPEQVISTSITLHGGSAPQSFQRALEVALEHKSGRLYAPLGTKRATFFIDDLHLPPHDQYGSQAVLELLRHALDYGNWFDLNNCVERVIQNCSFIMAMPPSRSWVSQARLRRHCGCLEVETPAAEVMQHIYETLAVSMLRTFDVDVQRMAGPLAASSVRILVDLSSVLMSTAERPHYFFTQHDLAKIFNGMQSHPELCSTAASVVQLWLFNCFCTFMGRLVTQEDRSMCQRIIARALDRMNETLGSREGLTELRKPSFLCVKQQGRRLAPYLVHSTAQLRIHICNNLGDSFPTVGVSGKGGASGADLAGMASLYHVQISHLTMALGRAGGHALLIGPGGGGKRTIASISARLLGYSLVELHLNDPAKDAGKTEARVQADLRNQLCNIYWQAATTHTDIALVIHDQLLRNEEVATLISETLAEGAFSQMLAIFPEARRLEIHTALRNEVRKLGMVDSHENCWMLFTNQVQRHLHLVVIASTDGQLQWGQTVLAFPLLLTGMSVCWFGGHSTDSMQDFASVHLSAQLAHDRDKGGAELIEQACRHMTLVHQAAVDMASKHSGQTGLRQQGPPMSPHAGPSRGNASTNKLSISLPTASLTWYCQAWSAIYIARRDRIVTRSQMAKRASTKLEAALTRLSDLETSIEDQKQMVEQKKIVANRLLAQVGQETALLDEQRVVLLEDEKKQLQLSEHLADLQAQLKARVDMAAPLLEKAELGLSRLEYQNISELRGIASPSDSLLAASRAIAVLLTPKGKPLPAQEALVWKEVKKMFSKVELFLNCLNRFNVKDANGDALKLVEEVYLSMPIFKEDPKDPPVVDGLKTWSVNIVAMFHIYDTIRPQQKKLNAASKEWEQMATKVSDLSGRVSTLEARLTGLMGNFQDATEEKNAAIARLEDLTGSCDIASKLAGALNVSKTNPIAAAKLRYEEEEESLLGDALVASALVTYAGWMDETTRDSFMQDHVLADLRAQKIGVSPVMPNPALQTFTDDATIARWKAKGLLASRYYQESSTIALHCASWPLLVDPDGLALDWLVAHVQEYTAPVKASTGGAGLRRLQELATPSKKRPQSGNKPPELSVVSNSSPDLVKVLRTCMSLGGSVAINGPLTRLRREMLMVLLRCFYMHKRVVVIELDGDMAEVHPDFRLFLFTGKGRQGFDPELGNMCTIINFTCSVAGLHESLLNLIISAEVPGLEERTTTLLDRRWSLIQERQHLEESMLITLGERDGIVLSDAVVSRLVDDLGLMDRVTRKLKATDQHKLALDGTLSAYDPVAETAQAIFQSTQVLDLIHAAYVFSTASFLDAVAESLRQSALELEPFEWQSIFKGDWSTSDQVDEEEEDDYSDQEADGEAASDGPDDKTQEQAAAADGHHADKETPDEAQPNGSEPTGRKGRTGRTGKDQGGDRAGGDVQRVALGERAHSAKSASSSSSRPASQADIKRSAGSPDSDTPTRLPRSIQIPDQEHRFKVLQTNMWSQVLRNCAAGMLAQDALVFGVYSAIAVAFFRTTANEYARVHEVLEVFLTFTNLAQKGQQTFQVPNTKPSWLSDTSYTAVAQLSQVKRGSPLRDLMADLEDFREMVEYPEPNVPWPEGWHDKLSDIEKWITIQSLRPDLAVSASTRFIKDVLGCADALEQHSMNHECLFAAMPAFRPILVFLTSSVLVTDVIAIIEGWSGKSVQFLTLGIDRQEEEREEEEDAITSAYHNGVPVIVEGVGADGAKHWVESVLDPLINKMSSDDTLADSGFRLILLVTTSQLAQAPSAASLQGSRRLPQNVAQVLNTDIMAQCSKIMFAPARGPRAGFLYNLRALTYFCDVELDDIGLALTGPDQTPALKVTDMDNRDKMLRPLLFSLSLLHAAMRSNLLSGAVKENERLDNGVMDLSAALCSMLMLWGTDKYNDQDSFSDARLLPWGQFRQVVSHVSLGALITDPWERRLFRVQLYRACPWMPGRARDEGWDDKGFEPQCRVDFEGICELGMRNMSFSEMSESVVEFWQVEGAIPRYLSGLGHTALVQGDANYLQKALGELRFVRRKRDINRQDKAKMTLDDIVERLPKALEMPWPFDPAAQGSPFYPVYVREIASMNLLLNTMLQSLQQLELALQGQTRVNIHLEGLIDAFCHDLVPVQWAKVSHPSVRALGGWFNDVVQRCDLLHDWFASRLLPPVVWLSGLFHPEAFITAVIMHHSLVNRWPLAETVLQTHVLQHYPDEYVGDQAVSASGVRVHGFHLDKASWDVKRGVMRRLQPGEAVAAEMPVILLKAVRQPMVFGNDTWQDLNVSLGSMSQAFECENDQGNESDQAHFAVPVYRSRSRLNPVVLRALLPTVDEDQSWILLGVCILLDSYQRD